MEKKGNVKLIDVLSFDQALETNYLLLITYSLTSRYRLFSNNLNWACLEYINSDKYVNIEFTVFFILCRQCFDYLALGGRYLPLSHDTR